MINRVYGGQGGQRSLLPVHARVGGSGKGCPLCPRRTPRPRSPSLAAGGSPSAHLGAVFFAPPRPDSRKPPSCHTDTPNSRRLTAVLVPAWSPAAWQAEGPWFNSRAISQACADGMGNYVGRID